MANDLHRYWHSTPRKQEQNKERGYETGTQGSNTKYQIKQEAKWEAQPIESNIVEHNPTLLYSGL